MIIELAKGKGTTYAFMHTGKLVERYEFETMVSSVLGRGVRYILMVRLITHIAINSTHSSYKVLLEVISKFGNDKN